MIARIFTSLLLATLLASTALSLPQTTACSGVQRERLSSAEWTVDLIRDEEGKALVVSLEATSIQSGTVVEVLADGAWTAVSAGQPVQGEAIRVSANGSAELRLQYGGCSDEWNDDQED